MEKKNNIDYEVEDSKPVENLGGNTGCGNGGDATSDKGNISAYYAIAAVLAVIILAVILIVLTNLK